MKIIDFFRNLSNSHRKKLNIKNNENKDISLISGIKKTGRTIRIACCLSLSILLLIGSVPGLENILPASSAASITQIPIYTHVIRDGNDMGRSFFSGSNSSESVEINENTVPLKNNSTVIFQRAYVLGTDGQKYSISSIRKELFNGKVIYKVYPKNNSGKNIDLYYTDNNNPPVYCEYITSRAKINIEYAAPNPVKVKGPDIMYLQNGDTSFTYTVMSPRGSSISMSLWEKRYNNYYKFNSTITKLRDISTPDYDVVEYQATVPSGVVNDIRVKIDYENRNSLNIYDRVTSEDAFGYRNPASLDQWRGTVGHNYDYNYFSELYGRRYNSFNLADYPYQNSIGTNQVPKGSTLNYNLSLNTVSSVINNDNTLSTETFSNVLTFMTLNDEPVNIPYFPGSFQNIFDKFLGYKGNFGDYFNTFTRNVKEYVNTEKGTAVTEFTRGPNAGMRVTVKITGIKSRLAESRGLRDINKYYDMMRRYNNKSNGNLGDWGTYMEDPNYTNDRGNTFLMNYSIKIENVNSDIKLKPYINLNSQGSFHPYFGPGIYDAQLFRDDNPRNDRTDEQAYTQFNWAKLSNNESGWDRNYLNLRNYDTIINKFMLNLRGERQFNHNKWYPLNSIRDYGGIPVQRDIYSTNDFAGSFNYNGAKDDSQYMNYLMLNYKIKNGYAFERPYYTYEMSTTYGGIRGEDLPEAKQMGFENGYNNFTRNPLTPPALLSIYRPNNGQRNNVFDSNGFNGYFFSSILSPNYMTSTPNISNILGETVKYAGENNTPISSLGSRTMLSVNPARKFYPLYTDLENGDETSQAINAAIVSDYDVVYNRTIQIPGDKIPKQKPNGAVFLYYELYGLGDSMNSQDIATVDSEYPLGKYDTIDINPGTTTGPQNYGPIVDSYGNNSVRADSRLLAHVMPGDRIDISKLTLNGPLGGNPDPDISGSFPPNVYSVNKLYLRAVYSDDDYAEASYKIELRLKDRNSTLLAESSFGGIPGLYAKPSNEFLEKAKIFDSNFRSLYRNQFYFLNNKDTYNIYPEDNYSVHLEKGSKIVINYEYKPPLDIIFKMPTHTGYRKKYFYDKSSRQDIDYFKKLGIEDGAVFPANQVPILSEKLRKENKILVGWYNANDPKENIIDFNTKKFTRGDTINYNSNYNEYYFLSKNLGYYGLPNGVNSVIVLYPKIVTYELPNTGSYTLPILITAGISLMILSYVIYRREFE